MKNIRVLNTNAVATPDRKDPPAPVRYSYSIRPAGGSFLFFTYLFVYSHNVSFVSASQIPTVLP